MVRRREIGLGQWNRYLSDKVESLVKAGTLEWETRVKDETPVDTGNLRNGWSSNIKPLLGEITNRVEYAAPVVYGQDLPLSWLNADPSGWRTLTPSPTGNRLGRATRQAYPDLIAKDLQKWLNRQWRRS